MKIKYAPRIKIQNDLKVMLWVINSLGFQDSHKDAIMINTIRLKCKVMLQIINLVDDGNIKTMKSLMQKDRLKLKELI